MASQPQPLCPAVPRAANAAVLAASSPEKGAARPKPPVRPKPRVPPKPALPAKPSVPPAPRHPRPELPSAEKLNRLAGPQPYGVGGALSRPLLTPRVPDTHNGKGLPSTLVEPDSPPTAPTTSRKGPAPFKVTPVPVAAKPERFPGTTVEQILAKMDSREGPGSPERVRLSPFCADPSSRFGSKTFVAFRRQPSSEAQAIPAGEAHRPVVGEDGRPVAEMSSGSPPAGPSCAGDPRGRRRPTSPPDVSSGRAVRRHSGSAPGLSPSGLSCLLRGSLLARSPLSSRALSDPPAPHGPLCSPPNPLPQPPALPTPSRRPGNLDPLRWPPAPTNPRFGLQPRSQPRAPPPPPDPSSVPPAPPAPPTSPERGPQTPPAPPALQSCPPELPAPPGSPEAPERSGSPSPTLEPPTHAAGPPGSPEAPGDTPEPPKSSEGPDSSPASWDLGLGCSSEEGLRPPGVGHKPGGSLSAWPVEPPEPSLGSGCSRSLSQSLDWQPASPPSSPFVEVAGSEGSAEGETPCTLHSWQDNRGAEGAPCPGGPVAQREEEEEEGEAERDGSVPCAPLCVMEPETPTQLSMIPAAPLAPDPPDTTTAGDSPGGPGRAEASSGGADPHADPGWLTELLASPGPHAARRGSSEGPQDLLGWSRKDLHGEFGVSSPRCTFSWTGDAAAPEPGWAAETEQDREFGTRPSWGGARSVGDRQEGPFGMARQDWGSGDHGTERIGEARPSCSDWTESHGASGSCPRDPGFGASKARWGTGYGLAGEEIGSGNADWSCRYGAEHRRQQDQEPGWDHGYGTGEPESRDVEIPPTWAGGYRTGDAETPDRELAPGWAGKYSSSDAEIPEKDFTLGWAGRSSTGDVESQDREFGSSRLARDSRYSAKDMESQDREFSPSRPAWDSEHRSTDTESQDREFGPSGLAWNDDPSTRDGFKASKPMWEERSSTWDTESQEQEFGPSQPAQDSECHSRDTENQDWEFSSGKDTENRDQEFSSSRDTENQDWEFSSSRDMENQDQEFSSSRDTENRDWEFNSSRDMESQDQEFSSCRDMESQEQEFSSHRPAWDSECHMRDTESSECGFRTHRPIWDDQYSMRDTGSHDREFGPSRPAWNDEHRSRDTEGQEQEFGPSRAPWNSECHRRDVESQDREFGPSRPARDDEHGSRDGESRDGEFSPRRPTWPSECRSGDTESQEGRFGASRQVWDDQYGMRDTGTQEQEFSASRSAWNDEHRSRDTESREREFSPSRAAWPGERSRDMESSVPGFRASRPVWDDQYGMRDMGTRDRESSPSQPAWDSKCSAKDMESQDREFGPSRPAQNYEHGSRGTESQEREFSPSRAAWPSECRSRDTESQDSGFGASRPVWDDQYGMRDTESWDQEIDPGRAAWPSECHSGDMESQESSVPRFRASRAVWDDNFSMRDVGTREQEFGPSQPAWDREHRSRHTESQDRELGPSKPAWNDEHSTGDRFRADGSVWEDKHSRRDVGTREQEFGPSRDTERQKWEFGQAARASEFHSRDAESQDQEFSPSRAIWDDEHSTRDMESQGQEFGPSRDTERQDHEFYRPGWAGERDIAHLELVGVLATGNAASAVPTDPGWGGAGGQERGATESRGCVGELEGAECHNQFGAGGTEQVPDPSCAAASMGATVSWAGGTREGLGDGHGGLSFGCAGDACGAASVEEPDWSEEEPRDADAKCCDLSEEQSLEDAASVTDRTPWSEAPSPCDGDRDPSEPPASPPRPQAAEQMLPDMGGLAAPPDAPDGEWLLPQDPHPEGPAGQEFTFPEDTELLDVAASRSKAQLGRQRRHRAPTHRTPASDPHAWTRLEPRPPASSDDEEPPGRRRGVRVPLFPSLSAAAIKAKLRGRNRLSEEGAAGGDTRTTPPKDPHVQRSKSCRTPSWSGRAPALPPRPERPPGLDAAPPHWLQALRLKKKKP